MFKHWMAFIGLFMLIAAVGCGATSATVESKSLDLDVSFLTIEQQEQWKQIQGENPGLVKYVVSQADNGISYTSPTAYSMHILEAVTKTQMSGSDRNTLYAVVGYAAAGKSAFLGEILAREISDTVLRDAVLIRVVDTYASRDLGRTNALRVLDTIQGKAARDAAYAILAAR